jgi:asparagine synthase (glutamine-hydrolysing)
LDSLNRLLYLDARLSLADDLLLGGDKVSMAWSVEARVPYLDLEYLAVAERIPSHYKISLHAGRKRMQRLVGRRLLPAPLARQLTAPGSGWGKKRGFDVPLGKWFERELVSTGAEFLTGREATLLQYFDRAALQDLIESHLARRADHTRRLIALLTLEAWHRRFVGGDASALARLSAKGARALV